MKYLTPLLLFVFIALNALACDVSLFELISSETKDTRFNLASSRLVVSANALSECVYVPKTGLHKLMLLLEDWLAFCKEFQNDKPEWAFNDLNWNKKFAEISALLGRLRVAAKEHKTNVHGLIMKFTRLIAGLYEFMPMNGHLRTRMNITRAFDELWQSVEEKNQSRLKQSAELLCTHCKAMLSFLPKALSDKGFLLYDRSCLVLKMAEQNDVFANKRLEILINIIEYEFIALNKEAISKR